MDDSKATINMSKNIVIGRFDIYVLTYSGISSMFGRLIDKKYNLGEY